VCRRVLSGVVWSVEKSLVRDEGKGSTNVQNFPRCRAGGKCASSANLGANLETFGSMPPLHANPILHTVVHHKKMAAWLGSGERARRRHGCVKAISPGETILNFRAFRPGWRAGHDALFLACDIQSIHLSLTTTTTSSSSSRTTAAKLLVSRPERSPAVDVKASIQPAPSPSSKMRSSSHPSRVEHGCSTV
jgi:hypothetical protein